MASDDHSGEAPPPPRPGDDRARADRGSDDREGVDRGSDDAADGDPPGDAPARDELAHAHLHFSERPELRNPVLVVAFEGWNDAGSAASVAARYLAETWECTPFCSIDPEEFYDFSSTRPTVRFDDDDQRTIHWPANDFSWARVHDDLDIVCLLGIEPELRWRTFCRSVTGLARSLDASLVLTLGALLADIPHSRATAVYGTAYDPQIAERLSLTPSRYEGPTGIVGVLHDAFRAAGIPSASLWAAVPAYVPNAPSPKAALALVERLTRLLEVSVDVDPLTEAAQEYEEQIDEVVADDTESVEFVARLEAEWDDRDLEEASGVYLVEEVERYLRGRNR